MRSCQDIIDTALKKLGVVGAGRSARTSDAADALAVLQGLYGSWIAAGAFGRLIDVAPTTATYTPYCSCRIYNNGSTVIDVTLPELVGIDWFYDYGWYRCCGAYNPSVTPRDGMAVVISDEVGGQTATWLYDGTAKKWQQIYLLQMDDDAPRSEADPDGLAAVLATECADMFGTAAGDATQRQAARYLMAMTQRFGMRREDTYQPTAFY